MFKQKFKNVDDALCKEVGYATELNYAEQISWILFLKYLEDSDLYEISNKSEVLAKLKRSILQKSFTGQLTSDKTEVVIER